METLTQEHETSNAGSLLQVVSFSLGKQIFAIDILQVQEIIRMLEITQVPNVPEFVKGVINLRGKVIPVVDLRKRFNLTAAEENLQERIIVVKGENKPVGMVVDDVSDVLRFPQDEVESAPAMVSNIDSQSIAGVVKAKDRLVILLDVAKILSMMEQSRQ